MGSIDTDPASNDIANKIVKAEKYYTIETNGLAHDWTGNVWMNPPYSSDLISKFVEKLKEQRANYNQAIILVNNATETQMMHKCHAARSLHLQECVMILQEPVKWLF